MDRRWLHCRRWFWLTLICRRWFDVDLTLSGRVGQDIARCCRFYKVTLPVDCLDFVLICRVDVDCRSSCRSYVVDFVELRWRWLSSWSRWARWYQTMVLSSSFCRPAWIPWTVVIRRVVDWFIHWLYTTIARLSSWTFQILSTGVVDLIVDRCVVDRWRRRSVDVDVDVGDRWLTIGWLSIDYRDYMIVDVVDLQDFVDWRWFDVVGWFCRVVDELSIDLHSSRYSSLHVDLHSSVDTYSSFITVHSIILIVDCRWIVRCRVVELDLTFHRSRWSSIDCRRCRREFCQLPVDLDRSMSSCRSVVDWLSMPASWLSIYIATWFWWCVALRCRRWRWRCRVVDWLSIVVHRSFHRSLILSSSVDLVGRLTFNDVDYILPIDCRVDFGRWVDLRSVELGRSTRWCRTRRSLSMPGASTPRRWLSIVDCSCLVDVDVDFVDDAVDLSIVDHLTPFCTSLSL